jgi:alpha-amylase/alpha-mannosidase (GH57 family)
MPRHHRFTRRFLVLAIAASASLASAQEKMQVGFLWHMHQPIYYPGENITQTQNANRFSFSLYDVHNQRVGPYTTWPRNAVQAGLHLPNLGTQVSFSGSLVENLNQLRNAGVNGGLWTNWNGAYTQARGWNTQQGNTRMDMIGFTYHHALGPLLDTRDLRMQIKMHKISMQNTFGGAYSRGFFPAETAFSHRMIPALVAEGLEWTLFDSIHLE